MIFATLVYFSKEVSDRNKELPKILTQNFWPAHSLGLHLFAVSG
jgi:hypothetical protein